MIEPAPLLTIEGLCKSFFGVQVLHDPPRAVRVVQRERALVSGAEDHRVPPEPANRACERIEVQQRAE